MRVARHLLLLAVFLALAAACRPAPPDRLSRDQVASFLPGGSLIHEVVHADLNGDGRDETFAATITPGPDPHPAAVVLAVDRRGRMAVAFQRRLAGETWLPIQVGRPAEGAPMVVVFAARGGAAANLSYIVVHSAKGVVLAGLDRAGLIAGRIRFVPEGLLETRGDLDRIYRWSETGWQAEDLGSQYVPPLPPETTTIEYRVDPIRGPFVDSPRAIRMRVGQHLFLRRVDQGEPSRLTLSGGGASYRLGPDGVLTLLQPDLVQINIEGPAYSGRTATLSLRIDP
jgi:hypothetical protein